MSECMNYPTLYRKRIMPDECVLLKDDIIISCSEDTLLTRWNAIRPKKDLHHGYSCYFLKEGIKLSKFYRKDNSLMYWYFDIVEYDYDKENNSLTSLDLLADVIVYPDGFVKVLDLDELAEALGKGTLSEELLKKCLFRLNKLLETIYSGQFPAYQKYIDDAEN
ncbi:hypothetical protein IMSAGC002_03207 [Lachnospiraceae bacterium]|jgi:protein associated with RNAse G/E|nr:hypothetical protein IMSAGC002_03207 [Lachnospiraceae bacterium]